MAAVADSLGGQILCASSREAMIYQASHLRSNAAEAMSLIAETILNPAFPAPELDAVIEATRYELRELRGKPEVVLPETLHEVAYGASGLGNPSICPESHLNGMNGDILQSFMRHLYLPERMVVAGAGIGHEELVQLADKHFSHLSNAPGPTASPATSYVGGYRFDQVSGDSDLTHIYVGFDGLPITAPGIYTLAVIQFLLGGGGSFSAGGPGKGMYSRFYTNILNRYPEIDHCSAFHHIYVDTSLFGVFASYYHGYHSSRRGPQHILSYLFEQLRLLLQVPVPVSELERAKNQLKSSLVMALESQATQVEDLGRQVLVHGYRIPVMEMCKQIDKVGVEDVMEVSHQIFGTQCNSPASVVVQGPVGLDSSGDELQSLRFGE